MAFGGADSTERFPLPARCDDVRSRPYTEV